MNYDSNNTNWKNIENGLQKYLLIMQLVKDSNVQTNEDFQKKFNGFYKIRQRQKSFYLALYEYLENNKNKEVTFEQVLYFLYQKFGRLEPSFSSKIVATINPDFPVWDSVVLANLNIKAPGYNIDKKIRFEKIVKIYDEVVSWYSDFLKTEKARDMIKAFDEKIGTTDITDLKKIDLILWQTRV